MTEESTKIQKMQMAVRELLETSSKPSASMKWTTPILAELEVVLGEIIENLIDCEYGLLKLVTFKYLELYGKMHSFLTSQFPKPLVALLPGALQKKNASTGCCEKEVE